MKQKSQKTRPLPARSKGDSVRRNMRKTCKISRIICGTTKRTKSAFILSHTKLCREDGTPCTSNERPNMLADHLEHKQWAIDPSRAINTEKRKILEGWSSSDRTRLEVEDPDISVS